MAVFSLTVTRLLPPGRGCGGPTDGRGEPLAAKQGPRRQGSGRASFPTRSRSLREIRPLMLRRWTRVRGS